MKYHIHVKGRYIGTVECSEAELRKALPWIDVRGSSVDVFCPPPKK